jgi:hypothetical protein
MKRTAAFYRFANTPKNQENMDVMTISFSKFKPLSKSILHFCLGFFSQLPHIRFFHSLLYNIYLYVHPHYMLIVQISLTDIP